MQQYLYHLWISLYQNTALKVNHQFYRSLFKGSDAADVCLLETQMVQCTLHITQRTGGLMQPDCWLLQRMISAGLLAFPQSSLWAFSSILRTACLAYLISLLFASTLVLAQVRFEPTSDNSAVLNQHSASPGIRASPSPSSGLVLWGDELLRPTWGHQRLKHQRD